jgi:non-specific serine/threonine protein kinase
MRGALAWTIDEGGDREAGLEMAASLEWFWNTRGDWREGRAWLERALERSSGPAGLRARASLALANLAERQGDFVVAREAYERALELIRPLNEPAMLARTLHNLAIVLRDIGEYDRAMGLEAEALEHFRLVCDARGIAVCLNSLGVNAAERGDYATAVRWFAETLDLCRALGSERGVAYALHNQGEAATRTGDLATAEALLGEGLELADRVGDRGLRASLLTVMASAAFDGGDVGMAADRAALALDVAVEIGDKRCIASVLEVAGCLAALRGDDERAVALTVAGAALRESIGHAASAGERAFVQRHMLASTSQLDPSAADRARRLGASLPLDRALVLAGSAIESTDHTG